MDLLSVILIAVGLSMDCFAVSIASSVSVKGFRPYQALMMALFFGGFQWGMTILGWLAGNTVSSVIGSYDHWLAFFLLAFVGGKMIYESFFLEAGEPSLGLLPLTMLSLATSIDALAVGASFGVLRQLVVLPSIIIGIVCFSITLCGAVLGRKAGSLFEGKIEIAGGLVLICIGLKILIEHLL